MKRYGGPLIAYHKVKESNDEKATYYIIPILNDILKKADQ